MTTVVVWLLIRLAYLVVGLGFLLAVGAIFHRRVEAYIDRHVRRALGDTVTPFRQPTHVRPLDGKVAVPRRLG